MVPSNVIIWKWNRKLLNVIDYSTLPSRKKISNSLLSNIRNEVNCSQGPLEEFPVEKISKSTNEESLTLVNF